MLDLSPPGLQDRARRDRPDLRSARIIEQQARAELVLAELQGNTVIANTNLLTGDAQASGVCFGLPGYVFSNQNRSLGLENVEVRGIKGNALMRRTGLRGKCSRTADCIRREQTLTQ